MSTPYRYPSLGMMSGPPSNQFQTTRSAPVSPLGPGGQAPASPKGPGYAAPGRPGYDLPIGSQPPIGGGPPQGAGGAKGAGGSICSQLAGPPGSRNGPPPMASGPLRGFRPGVGFKVGGYGGGFDLNNGGGLRYNQMFPQVGQALSQPGQLQLL